MHHDFYEKKKVAVPSIRNFLLSSCKHTGANLLEKWMDRFKAPVFASSITSAQL